MSTVSSRDEGRVRIVEINRPGARNAIDASTAEELADTFERFDADDEVHVAVLTGAGTTFCAGADLKSIAEGRLVDRVKARGHSPLGPVRIRELLHHHAAEQPFTRSLSGVEIPDEVDSVVVEGRDLVNGWGGETVEVNLLEVK